jgi:uncharacterized protein YdiU (UPF0061 family)
MRAKLGLEGEQPEDDALVDELVSLLEVQRVDLTKGFRSLSASVRGDPGPARALFSDSAPFAAWSGRWRDRVESAERDPGAVASAMDRVNPIYISRNHKVEEALAAAVDGDLRPFERLLDVLARPFEGRPGLEPYTEPAPANDGGYRTFCGT